MKPIYKHDCDGCQYLGTVHGAGPFAVDWYRHSYGDHVSMVGRYSDEPSHNETPYWQKPLSEYKHASGGFDTLSASALIAYALNNLVP